MNTPKCCMWCPWTRTRFLIMVLVLFCLTSVWSNILTFNIAVTCMGPTKPTPASAVTPLNGSTTNAPITTTQRPDRHSFTKSESTWITSTVAIAAVISHFPVVYVTNRIGIRTVYALFGLMSATVTLLIPTAIRGGLGWLILTRAIQGIAFSANFPVIGYFCAKWTYYKQTGFFVAGLVAYVQLAPTITDAVSGALCNKWDWPSVFYAHGVVSIVLFVLFGLLFRNNPMKHPFVNDLEVAKINRGKAMADKKVLQVIPYRAILSTPAIWAVWIGAIGNFMAVNLFFLFNPIYLSQVLGLSTSSTGLSAALPALIQFCVKLFCGFISDKIWCLSNVTKFRAFNTFAFMGSATCLILLGSIDSKDQSFNTLMLDGAAGLLGATTGGFFKASAALSKQYSNFVTGNISLVITITMIIVPFIVNGLTPNNTHAEWRIVFYITAVVQIITNIIFVIFVRGEPCEWTKEEWLKSRTTTGVSDMSGVSSVKVKDIPPSLPEKAEY